MCVGVYGRVKCSTDLIQKKNVAQTSVCYFSSLCKRPIAASELTAATKIHRPNHGTKLGSMEKCEWKPNKKGFLYWMVPWRRILFPDFVHILEYLLIINMFNLIPYTVHLLFFYVITMLCSFIVALCLL
jgi:hypothetical protein